MRRRVVYLVDGQGDGLEALLRSARLEAHTRPLDTRPPVVALLRPDLVIIDATRRLALALAVCRELADLTGLPILMRVASADESVELMCLAAGARQVAAIRTGDRLLLARLRAMLVGDAADDALRVGPLALARNARHLLCAGRGVSLSPTEFLLIEALMERPHHVLSRSSLMQRAWEEPCGERALESTLSRLRHKVLGAGGPRIAVPVRGVGYRLGIGASTRR